MPPNICDGWKMLKKRYDKYDKYEKKVKRSDQSFCWWWKYTSKDWTRHWQWFKNSFKMIGNYEFLTHLSLVRLLQHIFWSAFVISLTFNFYCIVFFDFWEKIFFWNVWQQGNDCDIIVWSSTFSWVSSFSYNIFKASFLQNIFKASFSNNIFKAVCFSFSSLFWRSTTTPCPDFL